MQTPIAQPAAGDTLPPRTSHAVMNSSAASDAIYTSTEQRGALAAKHSRSQKVASPSWRTVLQRLHTRLTRLSVLVSLLFLAIMIVMVVIVVTVTWVLTAYPIAQAFVEVHKTHVMVVEQRCQLTDTIVVHVANVFSALWDADPAVVNPSTMSESVLATITDMGFYTISFVKTLTFISQSLDAARVCYQTYDPTADERVLMDLHSSNGMFMNDAYLIDSDTHLYHEPRVQVSPTPTNPSTVKAHLARYPVMEELITAFAAWRNGTGPTPSRFLMWEAAGPKPTYIGYTYPVAAYDTAEALARRKPDGRAVVQVSLDIQRFFAGTLYSNGSRGILLHASSLRSGDENPYVIAASWVAHVANDTDVWTYRDVSEFYYMRVSTVDDNVMLAGLKHVRMSDFRRDAFQKRKLFWYMGMRSVVTWGNYTTENGLSLAYVVVDTAGPVRGLLEPTRVGLVCCTVFLVLALTLVLEAVLDAVVGHPLRVVGASLSRAGQLGNRKARRHIRDDAALVVSEVDALVDAHNEAMDILCAVEAYLPAALFGDDDDASQATDALNCSGSSWSGTFASSSTLFNSSSKLSSAASSSFFDSVASAAWQRSAGGDARSLSTMRMSVVTLRATARAAAPQPGLPPQLPQADDGASASTDSVVDDRPMPRVLEELRVLDRATYNAPTPAFASRWALQDYASVVLRVAEQHRGAVMQLTPDVAVVVFGGMMEALTRGNSAAALAPALESKACATDALCAVQFAQDVRERLRALAAAAACVPDVVALVETGVYSVGIYRASALGQSLSVAVGATAGLAVGASARDSDCAVLASPTTSQLLAGRVRFVPRCALHTALRTATAGGGARVSYTMELLYQCLGGNADSQAWRAQCGLLMDAVVCVLRGDYGGAMAQLERLPAAARGDMTLMSGALLGAAMLAAEDAGVASSQRYGTAQSGIVERLTRYCAYHLRHPAAANTLLPPPSYAALMTRQLPVVSTSAATEDGQQEHRSSITGDSYSSCSSINRTLRGVDIARLCGPLGSRPLQLAGVRDQVWCVPLRDAYAGAERPFLRDDIVLSTTGTVSQAHELLLQPGALSMFTPAKLRAFVTPCDSPYVIETQDLVVEEQEQRVIGIYEFVGCPTGDSMRAIFSHTIPLKLYYRQAFCGVSGLASLDMIGCAHPCLTMAAMVLLPTGMAKLKTLFGDPTEINECFVLPLNRWVSPEEARGEPTTILSNVYSFSVMALEFITRRLPYRWTASAAADRAAGDVAVLQEACGAAFAAALADGLIEVIDVPAELGMHASMVRLLRVCLQRDAAARPRPRDVLRMFRTDAFLGPLVAALPSGPWEAAVPGK